MSVPKYLATIGLEVHVQLSTKSKIFCGCAVGFGCEPNVNVCPVCLGLPGVLPVLNREAFFLGLRAVLAFKGTPSRQIKFDRKNYYYPDLPKGYQISQYDQPLGKGGIVEISVGGETKEIHLTRIHMEEDAGKLIHDQSQGNSLVDLNRAGTPLIEIVSEPDIHSPEEAYQYLVSLKADLRALGVSECDMEKGQLRCDANISIRRKSEDPLGTKVEIKNMNSFKAVRTALIYEIGRQADCVDRGEKIIQETRLWDDSRQKTFSMRSKEEAHDYRYFPEPDLTPFFVSDEEIEALKKSLPELPKEKKSRLKRDFNLSDYDAQILVSESDTSKFFDHCLSLNNSISAKSVVNWLIGPVFFYLNENKQELGKTRLTPELLLALIALVEKNVVSMQVAKDKVFPELIEQGADPEMIIKTKGLAQVSDESALDQWIEETIAANPRVVADFKSGKEAAAMFLVGQVMKKSQGKANPGKVQTLIRKRLEALGRE